MNGNNPRFDGFDDFEKFQEEIERFFKSAFENFRISDLEGQFGRFHAPVYPAINVRETDQEVVIEAEVPGMKISDLRIDVTEDSVTIAGERKSEKELGEEGFVREEYTYGSFSRLIPLPSKVASDKVSTDLKEGVLRLTIPKK